MNRVRVRIRLDSPETTSGNIRNCRPIAPLSGQYRGRSPARASTHQTETAKAQRGIGVSGTL